MQKRPPDLQNKSIILGVKIDDRPLSFVMQKIDRAMNSDEQLKIYTPNPEICLKAEQDEEYRNILDKADINIPDGFGLKLGAKILGETLENRITGVDLSKSLLNEYKEKGTSVYIILREDSLTTKEDLGKYFKETYPNIKLNVGVINKNKYTDCDDILNDINDKKPSILFVTLGAPRQEIWIHRFIKLVPSVKVALGIGGTFDFLSGKMQRAPKWMQQFGMEWFFRLYKEPSRLSRIKNATADFLLTCHQWKKRIDTTMRKNVLGVVVNREGKYLVQKNSRLKNHWQFPQGGIDEGEKPEEAVIREISEEDGIPESLLRVIKKLPATHKYTWLPHYQLIRGYSGQEQLAFLVEFKGENKDVDYKSSDEVEEVKWIDKKEILTSLHHMRREFTRKFINHL
jgi:N-acetylglucosaminyldiphosphoundecaprenol N-acetyl-beta-D-mannosaminyltransferase